MLNPIYNISENLLSNITAIERLYGQIESLKIPHNLELNLSRDNMIQSSYASNKIEGNPLTLPEVTNLLLDDRVPATRDEKEVKNYYSILQNILLYKDKPLTLTVIEMYHKKLMEGVDKSAGIIRNEKVVIGKYKEEHGNVSLKVKHDPPFHKKEDIIIALKESLAWTNNSNNLPVIIQAGIFHHRFVYIHPFEDGNGRVCRLVTALLFIKRNYMINKYFVLDDYYDIDRQEYSDSLHTADNGDSTKWLEYFSDGVKYSLQSALFRFKNAIRTLSMEQRPTPKEKAVLLLFDELKELTSTDVSTRFHVTRQQAHNLLKSLVSKGLVKRYGTTKASYYTIS